MRGPSGLRKFSSVHIPTVSRQTANIAKRLRKPSKRTFTRGAPEPVKRSGRDTPSPRLHPIPNQRTHIRHESYGWIPSKLTLCRVEPCWRRRWSNAKVTSSFECVDARCSFGVGVSLMDAVLQPAAMGSAYLVKSSCCLASLPHLASTLGNATRLEAAGGWQRAQAWPLARTDWLGTDWWHGSARTNACERMESAGAVRRSARVHVQRTVTVWRRRLDLLLTGLCRHARRNIRLY